MKNILEKIIAHKKKEVQRVRELYPIKLLEESLYYQSPTISLSKYLLRPDKQGIIAEIKRKSPSRGAFKPDVDIEQLSISYMQAGASALSVLTDNKFFGGSAEDLKIARKFNYCPILRKDFIIDSYQVYEARSIGADAILLIARILSADKLKELSRLAVSLGLEVLLELHPGDRYEELDLEYTDLIGVNNRSLSDFKVSLDHSVNMAESLPKDKVLVSESGIKSASDILKLREAGYSGFLIGEYFMSAPRPEERCAELITALMKTAKI
ncbi:MAG: indole-3-glycerol phosphate synthase TrpC [Candidatus Dadabacteria bacterium]|nr:MAG: indole-3-glycerol phosphate synthase TrpC [Candidatus Dadabacteria bacterium]